MAYTDAELEAAIERYLIAEISTPTLRSGAKDIVSAKRQVYDLIAAALLLNPDSYFYVIWLATNRLRGLVSNQFGMVSAIIEEAPGVSRPATAITSTADLANANAALVDLTGAMNSRSTGLHGSIGPTLDRFNQSIDAFTSTELAKNVVQGGDITKTAAESKVDIATRWTSGITNHANIVALATAVVEALQRLRSTKFPDSAVRDVVAKVQQRVEELQSSLLGSTGIQDSRTALLDLIAAKSILDKTTAFSEPQELRTSGSCTATTSAGTAATTVGTISGPWNYVFGTHLLFNLNGIPNLPVLPGTAVASLRSRDLSSWTAPPSGAEIAVIVDHTSTEVVAAGTPGSGAAFVSSVIIPGVTFDWDGTYLTMQSASSGDISRLELLRNTTNRDNFFGWFLDPGASAVATSDPAPAEDAVPALATSGLTVSIEHADYGRFLVYRDGISGHEARIWNPADSLHNYSDIPVGTRVQLQTTSSNQGFYRVAGGGVGYITLDRPLDLVEDNIRAYLFTDFLRLSADAITTSASLEIVASIGATATGLAAGAPVRAALSRFADSTADFGKSGVQVGDLVDLVAPSSATHTGIINAVTMTTFDLETAVPNEPGTWSYTIRSAGAAAYRTVAAAATTFLSSTPSSSDIDKVISRLMRGAKYSTELSAVLSAYEAALSVLASALDAYVIPTDGGIQAAVRAMQDSGFDRALDLFITLDLAPFFSMPDDGVSYKTWVVRSAATAGSAAVPVSRGYTGPQWRTSQQQTTTFDPRGNT